MKREKHFGLLVSVLLLVISIAGCRKSTGDQAPGPNIIYILADDLGYGELGCYGQEIIKTPCLDQMAEEGMMFTQHYSGSAVCAPSRYTLITGRHIGRSSTDGQGQRLGQDAFTIGKMMKQAGYATAAFGKWDSGKDPNRQGFDEFFGFTHSGYAHFHYPERVWRNTEEVEIPENQGLRKNGEYPGDHNGVYIHDAFTDTALEFIRQKKDTSFFLYLAWTLPHLELTVPENSLVPYRGRFDEEPFVTTSRKGPAGGTAFYDGYGYCSCSEPRATYAGMVSRLDRNVGRIRSLLKELGLDGRTLIIFSSDNGPARSDAGGYDREFFRGAGILREGKTTLYEGGIRVPMVACWPGNVPAGSVSSHVSYFPDIMPTLAELTGAAVTGETDGISLLPALLGDSARQRNHDYLYWQFKGKQAIRHGNWKLLRDIPGDTAQDPRYELYDLESDPSEKDNLAEQNPEQVRRLQDYIDQALIEQDGPGD